VEKWQEQNVVGWSSPSSLHCNNIEPNAKSNTSTFTINGFDESTCTRKGTNLTFVLEFEKLS